MLGAIFAALVVLLFLGNLRSTLIAALAIPISVIGTFALMWWRGFTLDTITLLALALAVGIVIDDAIVVLENIVRFIDEKGMTPLEAAVAATREIALAVLATTLSLLAVFVPVAFMNGIVGRFLKSFGLTMAFAIAVSLFVSFTLTPMLSSRWLRARRPLASVAGGKTLVERIVDRFYVPIERAYLAVLSLVMRRRWIVVVGCAVALASLLPLAADLGVNLADIASTLRLLVGGGKASTLEQGGEQFEVHARAERSMRADAAALALMTVPSSKLGSVALSDVVSVRQGAGPGLINRLNRHRQVFITGNVAPGFAEGDISDAFRRAFADLHMADGYTAEAAGRSKEMGKAGQAFLLAFALSFVFMYLILAAQFESWLHPVTILLALPLTLPFAVLSLIVLGQSLNIMSALGILVLFGVVKKNAILQIDHTEQLRRQGMPRLEAILKANRDRLRPILMTTVAFVAGMIPLVLSTGIGAGSNRATAGVVVGGQVLSLLLTLLATPVAYSLFDDVREALARRRARSAAGVEAARAVAAPSVSCSTVTGCS